MAYARDGVISPKIILCGICWCDTLMLLCKQIRTVFFNVKLKKGGMKYLLLTLVLWMGVASGFQLVDFDVSMQTDAYKPFFDRRPGLGKLLDFLRTLYQKQALVLSVEQDQIKIPQIAHHIWLGGKLPQEYEPYYASWRQHHPSWTFIFWTDNGINYDKGDVIVRSFAELQAVLDAGMQQYIVVDVRNLEFANKQYFDAANNYGERGDILDYEIVYRFGGTYIDADFECIRPLDFFHTHCDFYTGIQPLDTNMVQLGAALFGATPKHPILQACVESIAHNQHEKQIVCKTGPIYFTKMFFKSAVHNRLINVAFPASYFYPRGYEQKITDRAIWLQPESYGVHHWAGSWLKPAGFVQNDN